MGIVKLLCTDITASRLGHCTTLTILVWLKFLCVAKFLEGLPLGWETLLKPWPIIKGAQEHRWLVWGAPAHYELV